MVAVSLGVAEVSAVVLMPNEKVAALLVLSAAAVLRPKVNAGWVVELTVLAAWFCGTPKVNA